MENNNDKSKTEKFTPMNKSPKQEINRSAGDAYSEARTPQYDFRDDEEEGGANNKLVIMSVILAVLLVIAVVVSIVLISATKKEKPEDENPPVNIEETLEEEKEKEETKFYNIVFYGETVIQKNNYTLIDADLYDEEMNKVESRKIKISPETKIVSDGKIISENSLLYLIQNLAGEKIVFEGIVREEDSLAEKLTFEYHAEEMPETNEEILEEPTEEEPPVEEIPEEPLENQEDPVEQVDGI